MSKALALEFVRELLESGYTVEQAEHESCRGYDACDESGRSYIIRQGTIKAPWTDGPSFRFRKLAGEIAGQPRPRKPAIRFEQLELI